MSKRILFAAMIAAAMVASGAQARWETELGPEFRQLRKPLQDLQALRRFDPSTALRSYLLDDAAPAPANSAQTKAVALRPGERPPTDPDAT